MDAWLSTPFFLDGLKSGKPLNLRFCVLSSFLLN